MGSAIPCPLSTQAITATVPAIRAVEYPNMRLRVSHGASWRNETSDRQLLLPATDEAAEQLSNSLGTLPPLFPHIFFAAALVTTLASARLIAD
jgi:hypothetical protein